MWGLGKTGGNRCRTIIRTYRDKLFTESFLGHKWVPKTLIFAAAKGEAEPGERAGHGWPVMGFRAEWDARAKIHAHAENMVDIVREDNSVRAPKSKRWKSSCLCTPSNLAPSCK